MNNHKVYFIDAETGARVSPEAAQEDLRRNMEQTARDYASRLLRGFQRSTGEKGSRRYPFTMPSLEAAQERATACQFIICCRIGKDILSFNPAGGKPCYLYSVKQ